MPWSKFCPATGATHDGHGSLPVCPHCEGVNPDYLVRARPNAPVTSGSTSSSPQSFIVIDDGESSQAPLQSFASHTARTAEATRQKGFNQSKSLSKSKSMVLLGGPPDRSGSVTPSSERLRTVVHILRAHYKVRIVGSDALPEKVYIKWMKLARTFIHLNNRRLTSLQDFLEKDILAEIERLDPVVRSDTASLYLAVDWTEKEGPTQLSRSAASARDIKELLQHFKPVTSNASTNIYVLSEVKDKRMEPPYESDKELADDEAESDSSAKSIKVEDAPLKRTGVKLRLKMKQESKPTSRAPSPALSAKRSPAELSLSPPARRTRSKQDLNDSKEV